MYLIDNQIRDLCEKALMADDSEVLALLAESQMMLADHSHFVISRCQDALLIRLQTFNRHAGHVGSANRRWQKRPQCDGTPCSTTSCASFFAFFGRV
jgi:hypothetical protein